jgi:hypothetical protein
MQLSSASSMTESRADELVHNDSQAGHTGRWMHLDKLSNSTDIWIPIHQAASISALGSARKVLDDTQLIGPLARPSLLEHKHRLVANFRR